MKNFSYEGKELDLFSRATNWKKYWSSAIHPFLGQSILEVGAGIGATAKLFASCKVKRWVAIEPDSSLVERVKMDLPHSQYPNNYEIQAQKIHDLSSEYKFDTILYIDVLEHIKDDKTELDLVAKLLEPGGRIVILSPAHQYLFTAFDRALGHYRRHNTTTLLSVKPEGMRVESIFYIDSIGMLASLGNKLFLKSEIPTKNQIKIWDKCLVPVSRIVDRLTMNKIGKSIVAVFQLEEIKSK